jgi:hypothetical protein
MSLNLRSRREAELFKNAVKNVKGKIINSIRRNLFNWIDLSVFNLSRQTRNKSKEAEKKNILCTTSISYTSKEYVTGARNVIPNNILNPIFVFFFAIYSNLSRKINIEYTRYNFPC